jgi:hypothetical protein
LATGASQLEELRQLRSTVKMLDDHIQAVLTRIEGQLVRMERA